MSAHPVTAAGPSSSPDASGVAADLRDAFAERFGTSPAGVWSAPGRVNLIGEHTDYNGGLCLPIALPHRTYAAVRLRADDRLRVWSRQLDETAELALQEIGPGSPKGWSVYVAGVLYALGEAGYGTSGLDVAIDGRVPLGAGLSSSAALECAVAAAASDLCGLDLIGSDSARARLAELCVRAENDIALAPTGGMDQAASLRCRSGHALLLDCLDGSVQQIPFDLEAHGLVLVVVDTKAEHSLVDGQYASRRQACEEAARRLGVGTLRQVDPAALRDALAELDDEMHRKRVRHVVGEIQRVRDTVRLLQEGRVASIGPLLYASHVSLRDDYEVSCPELDLAVESSLAAGAIGARMTGGGFGGSAIALVPGDRQATVVGEVTAAFDRAGFGAPDCFVATAGPPAGRDL